MTEELAGEIEDVPPIRVVSEGFRWVIDYGGGITRRLKSRDEAVELAQQAAAAEDRALELAA
jgi:hypothetical protein